MIVRIATEGQFRLGSAALDLINEIDGQLMAAVENDDDEEFRRRLGELIATVRREGHPVRAEEIVESDLVLPPSDTTIEEAKHLFAPDGMVPG